jgi:hypothetical protein
MPSVKIATCARMVSELERMHRGLAEYREGYENVQALCQDFVPPQPGLVEVTEKIQAFLGARINTIMRDLRALDDTFEKLREQEE